MQKTSDTQKLCHALMRMPQVAIKSLLSRSMNKTKSELTLLSLTFEKAEKQTQLNFVSGIILLHACMTRFTFGCSHTERLILITAQCEVPSQPDPTSFETVEIFHWEYKRSINGIWMPKDVPSRVLTNEGKFCVNFDLN